MTSAPDRGFKFEPETRRPAYPQQVAPRPASPSRMARLAVAVSFLFGERDLSWQRKLRILRAWKR